MIFTPPNIPQLLRDKAQWLVWRLVQRPDEPKPRKVPFYANGNMRGWPNGRPSDGRPTEDQPQVEQGHPLDTTSLVSFDKAVQVVRDRGYTGLGFAPVVGGGIVALDFDSCVADGVITDSRIEALIADTYAEFSPSGTGLRAFYAGDLPSKKDNANKRDRVGGVAGAARVDGKFDIEFFGHNGFVTVTGDATGDTELWGHQDTVAELSDAVQQLFRERFGAPGVVALHDPFAVSLAGEANLATLGPEKLGWTLEQAREYLFACKASVSREEWRNALMAIHHEFDGSDDALDLVDEWSATGDTYAGRRDVEGRWESFGRNGGGAPLTGRWLLAWRREQMAADSDGRMRDALGEMQQLLKDAEDMVAVQTRVMSRVSSLLLEFPILEIEAYSLVSTRAKEFGLSVTKTEFRRMVRTERPPSAASQTPLTEFGNCERMLARYANSLMYCPDIATWYVWNGNHWRVSLGRSEVEHYAKETIRDLHKEADQHSDPSEFFLFCALSQKATMVANMVKLAESDPRVCVPSYELDKHKHLLGVQNGMVDLRTGLLLPPDPKLYITLVAGCEYNPGAKCPLFEKVMRDAFFDDMTMVDYVTRMFGYALQGDPKEDMMFIAFGGGSNGKSTIFNAVRKTFGAYAKSADASTFLADGGGASAGGPREDLQRLRGARFLYVNEPDENGELREGSVKAMTGGDAVVARGINAKHSVEIEPTWTVFMPTNHKPIIKGSDNGIWRRMGLIPFTRDFSKDSSIKKDESIRHRVLDEKAGILAMLVRAGMRYRKEGLNPPEKVLAASAEYRKDMDLLAEWLEECCVLEEGATAKVSDLWESWEVFARRRGMINYIRSSIALGRRLEPRFPAEKGGKGVRIRLGIGLRAIEEVF